MCQGLCPRPDPEEKKKNRQQCCAKKGEVLFLIPGSGAKRKKQYFLERLLFITMWLTWSDPADTLYILLGHSKVKSVPLLIVADLVRQQVLTTACLLAL
jgi:hypothetical protein